MLLVERQTWHQLNYHMDFMVRCQAWTQPSKLCAVSGVLLLHILLKFPLTLCFALAASIFVNVFRFSAQQTVGCAALGKQ